MEIQFIKGDLLNINALPVYDQSHINIIGQAVNCRGVQGAGLAKGMKAKYPEQFKHYKDLCDSMPKAEQYKLLGNAQLIEVAEREIVLNAFTQINYGRDPNTCYTVYGGVNQAFFKLQTFCFSLNPNDQADIYLPDQMCCGLANGDWGTVKNIIEVNLKDTKARVFFVQKP